ncbi:condensation domain-containing protein, partial [Streptomyces sp. NPDC017529]|uniref:condensation domain-containing protein n=1 Tax=Streptomyces sp. NPDC017529 TaxID=3365000 RepID=UPI0037A512F3
MSTTTAVEGSALAEIWPLSPLQQGILFHATSDNQDADANGGDAGDHGNGNGSPDVYVVQATLAVDGPLDADRLRNAWQVLLDRHPALRASFHRRKSGEAVQLIPTHVQVPWREADASHLTDGEASRHVAELAAAERTERFDLSVAPLLRLVLIRLAAERHVLVMTAHHILLDGWSTPVLQQEVSALYAAEGDTSVLPRATSYREYLAWLGRQDKQAARQAWRAELAGIAEPTLVAPADPTRKPAVPEMVSSEIDQETTRALGEFARTHGLTMNTVMQGAWALLLARLTGRTDVVFGTTVSGRPPELPGVETMVGLLINTLPVRVRLDGAQPALHMLTGLQERQTALLEHQHMGLAEIQRLAGSAALFDTLFAYENYPSPPSDQAASAEVLTFRPMDAREATHYPLTLSFVPGDRIQVWLDHRPDLVATEIAAALPGRLLRVLKQLMADPMMPVGRIDVLGAQERGAVVVSGRSATAEGEGVLSSSVPELIAAQVACRPDAVAVSGAGTSLSYGELWATSGRLAGYLSGVGVGRGGRVAVVMERSVELVV